MATANPPEVSSKAVVSFADRVALFVQEALTGRSPWLFPALLVAGLLMNLTPCVYPMIPITLNVLGRLGRHAGAATNDEEEHWSEGVLRAAIYVLGIILTYSVMGVVAGMTGTLFGSLLQSQAVLMGLALLFIVLGNRCGSSLLCFYGLGSCGRKLGYRPHSAFCQHRNRSFGRSQLEPYRQQAHGNGARFKSDANGITCAQYRWAG